MRASSLALCSSILASVVAEERWWIAPYFFVADVVKSANYYRDTLGFSFERFWGEPARLARDKGRIVMNGKNTGGTTTWGTSVWRNPEGASSWGTTTWCAGHGGASSWGTSVW